MRLSEMEKDMLAGKQGRLKQAALENIVKFAEVVGAEALCPVSKAHLYCGAHNYLKVCGSKDFHEVFTVMQLARQGEMIPFTETDGGCFAQSDVSVCDFHQYEALGQTRETFEENRHFLDMARRAGVMLAGTCAPYLTGWLPVAGEHFVSTESSVTIVGNSLWGARGNSDGIEAAFWSAVCGRTPAFGLHLLDNRGGTHHFIIKARLESLTDWDLLGKAIGRQLPANAIPVITGDFARPDFNQLRQFLTALAISSNAQLCHIVGLTPEARTLEAAFKGRAPQGELRIGDADLAAAYEVVASPGEGPINLVSLGCPHYDLSQVREAARLLEGRRVHPDVKLMIWAPLPIKYLAEINGLSKIIEEAGGGIYAGTCPTTVGPCLLEPAEGLVFDSFKMCLSAKNMYTKPVYLGGLAECLAAAGAGRWREEFRWRAK